MYLSGIAVNQGVNIHYLDSIQLSDHQSAPIIICPGLSETAEEYEDLLTYLLPRRGIALSFRGRGRSDTPLTNYDLIDHIGDLEAVIKESELKRFHLYGNSRGVSYALGYAQDNQERLLSLVVQDYPAEHKQMTAEWAEDYFDNYLLPTGRNKLIRQQTVKSIQRESTAVQLSKKLGLPILVIRGLLEGSLISDTDLLNYRNYFRNLMVCEFAQSCHNIHMTEKDELYSTIKRYLDGIDQT
ncbi:alpha/beta fold hydrolase [Paenibacillus prosopidis]|uniref:Alpha/beta hydrolase family protein n=1 Tax=Paenibacillus prosopidis TaxID=630520 RepID=A0A368W4N0_9BACL|nr:alpha/beta hydrolase [Paenibacillus prosopidis]RCW50391.1 alpha/beta hydrolase family protein [Paenibacillus prosopidis]